MRSIDATTAVCGLFGHPVGHSLSPEMHNAAFAALGLPFVYVAHDVQPGNVRAAMEGIRVMGYRGLSVTIPHKVAALECVDEVEETAKIIGCINTVVNNDGHLIGSNSDGRGRSPHCVMRAQIRREPHVDTRFWRCRSGYRSDHRPEAPPEKISLLGVQQEELALLARDVQDKGSSHVSSAELTPDVLRQEVELADILLHCSPVGMHPNEGHSLVPAELLGDGLAVFDAVYNPRAHQADSRRGERRLQDNPRHGDVLGTGIRSI